LYLIENRHGDGGYEDGNCAGQHERLHDNPQVHGIDWQLYDVRARIQQGFGKLAKAGAGHQLLLGLPRKNQRMVLKILDRKLAQSVRGLELLDWRHATLAEGKERMRFNYAGRGTCRDQSGN
jgi:hypothetical protein